MEVRTGVWRWSITENPQKVRCRGGVRDSWEERGELRD